MIDQAAPAPGADSANSAHDVGDARTPTRGKDDVRTVAQAGAPNENHIVGGIGTTDDTADTDTASVAYHANDADHADHADNNGRLARLVETIRGWGSELGFDAIRIADVDLAHAEPGLLAWLAEGCHGDMDYMANHGVKRARPAELVPGTLRAIVARMPYLPAQGPENWRAHEFARLDDPATAQISLYARGRDYHKVLRNRLQQLATRIEAAIGAFGYRVFTDSAPVMEVALATQGGLGWRGKHTLLLDREGGSMFFLGEILIDVPFPVDSPESAHCGGCRRCIDVCPTQAILAPFKLDARRCISYLTIEHKGPIPVELRAPMGNRVYGCDDCQLACPWNKFAHRATLPDFDVRNGFDAPDMVDLFLWSEADFNARLEGSPIRRIGHERWLRNLAVGLGNSLRATADPGLRARIRDALRARLPDATTLVGEHIAWALAQDQAADATDATDSTTGYTVQSRLASR